MTRVTVDMIDIGLAQCAELIERLPDGDFLWPIFERLEREREMLVSKTDKLAAARERITQRAQHQTGARS
ncbi:hypothetical protein F4V89_12865 [Neorhizobium galegae]|nr:hypothetical protein F4V89_12865 [Neorhizobium galegae]